MNPATFTTFCQSAVYYDGQEGTPVIAGGVDNGAPWVLLPFGDEAKLRVLPVANLKEEKTAAGFQWKTDDGTVQIALASLEYCEEFNAGDVQHAIDEQAAHFASGEGKAWLDEQRKTVEPVNWTRTTGAI